MTYSCTDLADSALEAAAALAKAIGAPPPDDEGAERFGDSPARQADYIVDTMDAAEVLVNKLRAMLRETVAPGGIGEHEFSRPGGYRERALALLDGRPKTAGPVHIAAALPAIERPPTFRGKGNFFYLEDGTLLSGAINADGSFDWDNPTEVDLHFLSGDCSEADGGDECLRALATLRGYSWRLTPAGAWVLMNTEGAECGNAYANPSGAWTGAPWGREIRNFDTAEKAKAHVLRMLSR